MDAPAVAVTTEPTQMVPSSEPAARPSADLSPVDQAIQSGDTSAFKEARRKERLELKGLLKTEPGPARQSRPDKPVESRTKPNEPQEKPKNAGVKQRIQQVDPEIQELQDKLRIRAELKRQLAETERPQRPEPKAETPAQQETGWQKYKNLPGAPKS
ncbi:MAG: hypothetical protein RLY20_869, partial [Verrucomicrobiota bacterium]